MTDTPEAVRDLYRTWLMGRSGAERLKMGCAMFDMSRAFARANLQAKPHTDEEVRVGLFVRTYGGDFDPDTIGRIAEWLSVQLGKGE